jgi:hypothetical protein
VITTAVTDAIYENCSSSPRPTPRATTVERQRKTTINHAMKSCRRAWNIAARRNPGKFPLVNPFAQMGLISSDRETPTATFDELKAFRVKAVEMGHPSLATAALLAAPVFSLSRSYSPQAPKLPHHRSRPSPAAARLLIAPDAC